jgi:hypothetical protein
VDDFIKHLQAQGVSRNRAQILFNNARRAAAAAGGAMHSTAPTAQRTRTVTLTGE